MLKRSWKNRLKMWFLNSRHPCRTRSLTFLQVFGQKISSKFSSNIIIFLIFSVLAQTAVAAKTVQVGFNKKLKFVKFKLKLKILLTSGHLCNDDSFYLHWYSNFLFFYLMQCSFSKKYFLNLKIKKNIK